MGPLKALSSGVRGYARFSGRASRSEYWWLVLWIFAVAFSAALTDLLLFGENKPALFTPLVTLLLILPTLSVGARRLHDIGRSGWWLLLNYIPVFGFLLLVYLFVKRSENGENRYNSTPKPRALTVALAVVLALPLLTLQFVYRPFWVPSGSMKPTLLVGDYILVNKTAYGLSDIACPVSLCGTSKRFFARSPLRGDVVTFLHPVTGIHFIKRVIGLPGDRIQITDGLLFINGQQVDSTPEGVFEEPNLPQGPVAASPRCQRPTGFGAVCIKSRSRETLPEDKSYSVLNIVDEGMLDNTREYIVPPEMYFVMGDNRDNSADSRIDRSTGGMGFIPVENLHGRLDFLVFSSTGRSIWTPWTWRRTRYLERIE